MMMLFIILLLLHVHWNTGTSSDGLYKKCKPKQVHLTVGRDPSTSMMVSFSSSSSCKHTKALVLLGKSKSSLNKVIVEKHPPSQYNYTSPVTGSFYSSDTIHHILVKGLKPSTTYHYQCVIVADEDQHEADFEPLSTSLYSRVSRRLNPMIVDSGTELKGADSKKRVPIRRKVSSLTTAPPPGKGLGNLKFAFVGDVGLKPASNTTIHHMARDQEINSILLVGDVAYANTVQSKWDMWFEMMEHLIQKVPLQTAPGNHEIEIDGASHEIYVPYDSRFFMPQVRPVEKGPTFDATFNGGHDLPYDFGNAYYAYTYGTARFIVLCSFSPTTYDSKQYNWLKKELQSIDRSVTPWVFVSFHVPLYNTFGSHNHSKVGEEMKDNMEHLFVYYRVNVVFSGHVHAYMRSKNLAYGYVNKTGPQYVIIGDGGFGNGSTYQHVPAEPWVAKRDAVTHGYGTIELLNVTHARWRWVRNVNEHLTTIHDHAYIHNQLFL